MFQRRLISKLHLVKDDQGLGIHIAGGRGCKKGDIGIFVAAVTEGGAAFRSVKRHISIFMCVLSVMRGKCFHCKYI